MKIAPKLHVFGHIHSGYGQCIINTSTEKPTILVNAAHMNEDYDPVNPPIKITL
jgi:Icc-related predicted phosphoesterase